MSDPTATVAHLDVAMHRQLGVDLFNHVWTLIEKRGEPALWHARRCLEMSQAAAEAGEAESWDVPAAFEAMARAHAIAGDRAAALEWRDRARVAIAAIPEEEDREQLEGDLATLPL